MRTDHRSRLRRLIAPVMMGGGIKITYALNDSFTTDDDAPLTSPRTCEPGPGIFTATQNDGQFSISSAKLNLPAQTTPAFGDLILVGGAQTRAAGLAFMFEYTMTTAGSIHLGHGWYSNAAVSLEAHYQHAFLVASAISFRMCESASNQRTYSVSSMTGNSYRYCIILRTAGAFYVRDSKLTHVSTVNNSATLYPVLSNYNAIGTVDYARVGQLGGPWLTTYGPGALHTSGSVAAGTAFTHDANALIYFTLTNRGTAGNTDIRFRRQDADNYWQLLIASDGSAVLNEVVAGAPTSRGTAAAGIFANGERCGIAVGGVVGNNTIHISDSLAHVIVYATANNFATATAGEVAGLATDAVVSNLEIYPVDLSGSALAWITTMASG